MKKYELEVKKLCEDNKIYLDMKGYKKLEALDDDRYFKLLITPIKNFINNNREQDTTLEAGSVKVYAKKKEEVKESSGETIEIIKEIYPKIIKVLKKYVDLREDYYNLIVLWIIGTYFHKNFPTYCYLFFNAMKGSGKTRLLKLISNLSKNGEFLTSLNEAVLFRTAKNSTFCIDEFERIGSKEKSSLRELLNSAYKQGINVKRARKVKKKVGGEVVEDYEIENFNVYCPICMANIWGMEEVLADRCITLVLEKSNRPEITKLLELFDQDDAIKEIIRTFSVVSEVKLPKNNIYTWNSYLLDYYNNNYTNNTNNITNINNTNHTFFNKILETSLDSRNLELFFPLFIIADLCGEDVLKETLETSKKFVQEKKVDDITESKDIALIDFLSEQEENKEYIEIKDLTKSFKVFLEEDDENAKWTNTRWVGRALKRLALIKEKRRVGHGVEVVINFKKAKVKIKMFKEVEPKENQMKIDKEEEKVEVEKIK